MAINDIDIRYTLANTASPTHRRFPTVTEAWAAAARAIANDPTTTREDLAALLAMDTEGECLTFTVRAWALTATTMVDRIEAGQSIVLQRAPGHRGPEFTATARTLLTALADSTTPVIVSLIGDMQGTGLHPVTTGILDKCEGTVVTFADGHAADASTYVGIIAG